MRVVAAQLPSLRRHRNFGGTLEEPWKGSVVYEPPGLTRPPHESVRPSQYQDFVSNLVAPLERTNPSTPSAYCGSSAGGEIVVENARCSPRPLFHTRGGCPKTHQLGCLERRGIKLMWICHPRSASMLSQRSSIECMYETMSLGQEGEKCKVKSRPGTHQVTAVRSRGKRNFQGPLARWQWCDVRWLSLPW